MQSDIVSELEFEFSIKPSEIEEFSQFLVDFNGKAIYCDENADEKVVARLKGQRLDLSTAREYHKDLQELFDCISAEISDLGTHILTNNECYTECCSRDEEEKTPCAALVYIEELVVEKAFRSKSVGREMLKRMSQVLDLNNALVALKAMPILDKDMEKRTPEQIKQLKHFYSKLGFRHSGEHFMVKDARDCHAQRKRALAQEGIHI